VKQDATQISLNICNSSITLTGIISLFPSSSSTFHISFIGFPKQTNFVFVKDGVIHN
jgi:hypothetical protein